MTGFSPVAGSPLAAAAGDIASPPPGDSDLASSAAASTALSAQLYLSLQANSATTFHVNYLFNGVLARIIADAADSAESTDELVAEVLADLRSSARAAALLASSGSLAGTLSSTSAATDALHVAWLLLLADTAAGADPLEGVVRRFAHLEDVLLASAVADSRLSAVMALAAAAEAEDRIRSGWSAEIADTAQIIDAIASRVVATLALEDAAEASADAAGALRVTVLAEDAARAGDDLAAIWRGTADLSDTAIAYLTIRLGDAEYRGWAMNTDLRAVTEHRNVPFDSYETFRGRHYAAGPGGIEEITGKTDNGEPIDAWLRPFLTEFGTGKLKRVPDVYLGLTSTGDLLLKAITRDTRTGVQYEDWYRVEKRQANGPAPARAQLGRGLKSLWWGLELRNIDGADFRLQEIAWRRLILDRRL